MLLWWFVLLLCRGTLSLVAVCPESGVTTPAPGGTRGCVLLLWRRVWRRGFLVFPVLKTAF